MNLMMRVTGALDLLLLAQMPPKGAESPDGVHRITLNVTLLGSGRLDSFKGTFHAAVACLMAHQPVPWGVLLRCPRIKVQLCRGHKVIF